MSKDPLPDSKGNHRKLAKRIQYLALNLRRREYFRMWVLRILDGVIPGGEGG